MAIELFGTVSIPSVPIAGIDERFPVGRIFCVGRNYADHVAEMGGSTREPPFFFTKFAVAVVQNGARLQYPLGTANFHFEGELVVAIGKEGSHVQAAEAQ